MLMLTLGETLQAKTQVFRALGKFEMAFWFFIKCFFRLVERKYPTDTVKCFFYSTSSICVSRFESQYIHLKAVLSK